MRATSSGVRALAYLCDVGRRLRLCVVLAAGAVAHGVVLGNGRRAHGAGLRVGLLGGWRRGV